MKPLDISMCYLCLTSLYIYLIYIHIYFLWNPKEEELHTLISSCYHCTLFWWRNWNSRQQANLIIPHNIPFFLLAYLTAYRYRRYIAAIAAVLLYVRIFGMVSPLFTIYYYLVSFVTAHFFTNVRRWDPKTTG